MSKKSSTALESALAWMEKHAAEKLELGALRKLTAEVAQHNEDLKELAVKLGTTLDRRETALKKLKDELKAAKTARKATPANKAAAPKAVAASKPAAAKKTAPSKKATPAKKTAAKKSEPKAP